MKRWLQGAGVAVIVGMTAIPMVAGAHTALGHPSGTPAGTQYGVQGSPAMQPPHIVAFGSGAIRPAATAHMIAGDRKSTRLNSSHP